jgi:hypothetical protein
MSAALAKLQGVIFYQLIGKMETIKCLQTIKGVQQCEEINGKRLSGFFTSQGGIARSKDRKLP